MRGQVMRAEGQRRVRLVARALLFGLAHLTLATGVAAADPCYQDPSGRIVTRRRPGYVEVPCPGAATPPGTPPPPAAPPAPSAPPPPAPAAPETGPSRRAAPRRRGAPPRAPAGQPPAPSGPPASIPPGQPYETAPLPPGYPPPGPPGYPPPDGQPGYPPAPPAYPPQPAPPGYPSQPAPPGYPPQPAQPGYPPSQPLPPAPAQPAYPPPPPSGQPAYPPPGAPTAGPSRIPRPALTDYVAAVPVPDRWRIVETLGLEEHWYDPYNRNVLKADRPFTGEWFFNLGVVSDSVLELRELPTPVGGATTQDPSSLDTFGGPRQGVAVQNLAAEFVLYKGDTVFRPPNVEFRFTPVFNYTYARIEELGGLKADPREGRTRSSSFLGIQAAFLDFHLRNASERFDFDSLRLGIQPFSADFRGFLFQDNQLGVRLFGTRANNTFQYNLAYFRRLEKDSNSGLNDLLVKPRRDDVVVGNIYLQDTPVDGFTSQLTVLYNRNREGDEIYYDKNDVIQRPASLGREAARNYDVVYGGYNGDGHFGWLNLTASVYYALGRESAGTFVPAETRISALFGALEASVDFDWIRWRLSGLYGSGDEDPFDDRATGFDAVLENPQFAGADTSYWIRQAVPLIGGGKVALSSRNGVLASLRSSKDEGQSNFTNPGIILGGLGFDLDLLPSLRLSGNGNALFFDKTAVIEVARNQGPVPKLIGYDLSAALTWRPLMSQNIVVRVSYATLLAGGGAKALFPEAHPQYLLFNLLLAY